MHYNGGNAESKQTDSANMTRLLHYWQSGQQTALNQLIDTAYQRLHQIGHKLINKENRFQTLQTQALVHEAYLRFLKLQQLNWRDRHHFFAVWTGIMRRILIDRARAGRAAKRGGNNFPVTYNDSQVAGRNEVEIFDLCDALEKLGNINSLQKEIVELRYFAGLSVDEVALVLELSPATVKRKWTLAQAWLYRQLNYQSC